MLKSINSSVSALYLNLYIGAQPPMNAGLFVFFVEPLSG